MGKPARPIGTLPRIDRPIAPIGQRRPESASLDPDIGGSTGLSPDRRASTSIGRPIPRSTSLSRDVGASPGLSPDRPAYRRIDPNVDAYHESRTR